MSTQEIKVPNIGEATDVEVIEVLISKGDHIKKEDSLVTLESDKASMEIPSPIDGIVDDIKVKIGDKVSEGSVILTVKSADESKSEAKVPEQAAPTNTPVTKEASVPTAPVKKEQPVTAKEVVASSIEGEETHAGPAVRRLARELGVDLSKIQGTGPKDRILKEDLQQHVKKVMQEGSGTTTGGALPKMPAIDFSKFGEVEQVPLNKIKKLTGINVHRSWVNIPHVTQFGQADITDLEAFRKESKTQTEKEGVKLTPLVFIMKAVVAALKEFPQFNASLDPNGEILFLKKYFNLGIAVDTPNGLVVPVVRDVDKKGMLVLAKELAEISQKARVKGLTPAEMSGSCFTISSLGGIGGTAFTPIINAPDVAILGVSKASITPVYQQKEFVPRLMLPLSLSYDHRVIDGADGARFIVYLDKCLSDIRTLLL